jgi:hypothetical protein
MTPERYSLWVRGILRRRLTLEDDRGTAFATLSVEGWPNPTRRGRAVCVNGDIWDIVLTDATIRAELNSQQRFTVAGDALQIEGSRLTWDVKTDGSRSGVVSWPTGDAALKVVPASRTKGFRAAPWATLDVDHHLPERMGVAIAVLAVLVRVDGDAGAALGGYQGGATGT